jgi:hypothetical protein
MAKKLVALIGLIGLGSITLASSMLLGWGGDEGWVWNGVYIKKIESNKITVGWYKIPYATNYCVAKTSIFKDFNSWDEIVSNCKNIWDGGSDYYNGEYSIVGDVSDLSIKKVYVVALVWDQPIRVVGSVVIWRRKNIPGWFELLDTNGYPYYMQAGVYYWLRFDVDFDWDGILEWCWEDVWFDQSKCTMLAKGVDYSKIDWSKIDWSKVNKSKMIAALNNWDYHKFANMKHSLWVCKWWNLGDRVKLAWKMDGRDVYLECISNKLAICVKDRNYIPSLTGWNGWCLSGALILRKDVRQRRCRGSRIFRRCGWESVQTRKQYRCAKSTDYGLTSFARYHDSCISIWN